MARKKIVIIAAILFAFCLSACSIYTCPTYAKQEQPKPVAKTKI